MELVDMRGLKPRPSVGPGSTPGAGRMLILLVRLLQVALRPKATLASVIVLISAFFVKGAVPVALYQLVYILPLAPHLLFFYLTSVLIALLLNRAR